MVFIYLRKGTKDFLTEEFLLDSQWDYVENVLETFA